MKEQQMKRIFPDAVDAAGGVLVLGVWAEVIPIVLGVLGIGWFILRGINFFRVNVLKYESWKGL